VLGELRCRHTRSVGRSARTSRSKLCTNFAFLFFRTQPAAGSYPQFCLLQPVHAAASLRMLAASAGFPLQNIDAQRQQGRQPWGQPTEGLCTPRRAGSVCRTHPPPEVGLYAGRRAGNPSRFMCAHCLHRVVCGVLLLCL
jgi:hypothetical protein